jgi:uncharacterized protein (DUF488 family)
MNVVFTIGYEGTDIDRFAQTLKAVGVEALADVRAVALSRKKGFSKTALGARLTQEGIEYIHLKELGDPKPGREAARAGRHEQFRKIYSEHLSTGDAQTALSDLQSLVRARVTCLLCFEREPNVCHRSIIAQQIRMNGHEIFNLYGDDPARYVDFHTKLSRYHPREGAAAA